MPLPGAELNIRAVTGGAGDPSDTGAAFMLGQVPRGPLLFEVSSYRQLVEVGGPAPANGVLHQAAEAAFAAGLSRLFVLRVVGAAATAASLEITTAEDSPVLTATASSVGGWGNGLKVEIAEPSVGTRRLVVSLDDVVVEQSPIASTRQELLDWALLHARYVTLAPGTSDVLPPEAAATALSGGSDDAASINAAGYEAALARITRDHPVGQLLAPGVHDEDVQLALLEKAKDPTDERFAVLDCDPTHDVGQKIAAAGVLRASGNGAAGALVAQRVRVPAPGGGIRWVPGSAIYAGRVAATDAIAGPGQVPAGETFGESPAMLDVEQTYTEIERERLNEAGITVIAPVSGAPRIYGGRTLADGQAQEAWRWVSGWRVTMRVARRGREVLERYVLKRRDGRNSILIGASMDLQTMLEQERIAGNVFGAASGDGYTVDTSIPRVNTEEGLREGYLRGEVQFDVPGVAERVVFDVGVSAAGTTNSN
jgi:hypothetical protein